MASFFSWNSSERGERDYVEHVRGNKPSRFDRIIVTLSLLVLLVLAASHLNQANQTPPGNYNQNNSDMDSEGSQANPDYHCMHDSPYRTRC